MSNNGAAELRKTYYATGSGLFPVPPGRRNEIPRLRAEHHASEVRVAFMAAWARKPA